MRREGGTKRQNRRNLNRDRGELEDREEIERKKKKGAPTGLNQMN